MTEATVDAEELIRDLQGLLKDASMFGEYRRDPSSKEDYREEVERLADSVLNEYDQDISLVDRIHDAVDNSSLVYFLPKCSLPIRYHEHEPCEPEIYMEGDNPIQGLAFAYLRADVRAEVEKRKEASENESPEGGSRE